MGVTEVINDWLEYYKYRFTYENYCRLKQTIFKVQQQIQDLIISDTKSFRYWTYLQWRGV